MAVSVIILFPLSVMVVVNSGIIIILWQQPIPLLNIPAFKPYSQFDPKSCPSYKVIEDSVFLSYLTNVRDPFMKGVAI